MSRKFLTNIDLVKNELQNARIQNLGTAPSSPVEGQVYQDSGTHHLMVYDGTTWQRCDNLTAAEILTAVLGVDGSGSGLDSDLLDGQHGSYYLARGNHTGTQLASTISDFDTQVRTSRLDQMAAPTAAVSFNSQRITSVATPTSANDAVNKAYADSLAAGLDPKASCRAATTANITLSGAQTIDGVSVIAGDRVLVKNQSTGSQNGIYVCAAGAWSRSTDADADAEVTSGLFTFIEEGTANGSTGWLLSTANPIVVGTTALTFVQFSQAGVIVAGAGLTKTGNTIDVVGTASRITVAADSIDIASDYVGQTSIITVGTLTTGVWNGTKIDIPYGGTNATTAAGARTNLGATGKYSALIGDGSSTSIAITQSTHGLASNGQMIVAVYDASTGAEVIPDISINNSNGTCTIGFATAPATNSYRVVIIG